MEFDHVIECSTELPVWLKKKIRNQLNVLLLFFLNQMAVWLFQISCSKGGKIKRKSPFKVEKKNKDVYLCTEKL